MRITGEKVEGKSDYYILRGASPREYHLRRTPNAPKGRPWEVFYRSRVCPMGHYHHVSTREAAVELVRALESGANRGSPGAPSARS